TYHHKRDEKNGSETRRDACGARRVLLPVGSKIIARGRRASCAFRLQRSQLDERIIARHGASWRWRFEHLRFVAGRLLGGRDLFGLLLFNWDSAERRVEQ